MSRSALFLRGEPVLRQRRTCTTGAQPPVGLSDTVGRTRNTSELVVLERKPKRLVYRYARSFDRSRFQEQETVLRKMLKRSNRVSFSRFCIDRHGIEIDLAENLRAEFRSGVEGEVGERSVRSSTRLR
jgi:hypothetical protein